MNTCLVWGSSCRMSSTSRGKSLTTATAVSFSPSGASRRYRSIDGREQERRVGKELLSILAREYRRGAGDRHDQVRLGTIGEGGSDVVDHRLFGRADKPCRTDDDLHDVHGSAGALVQIDAEVAGEVSSDQVAAGERLQHQDLPDRRLRVARRRGEHGRPARPRHRGVCCPRGMIPIFDCDMTRLMVAVLLLDALAVLDHYRRIAKHIDVA